MSIRKKAILQVTAILIFLACSMGGLFLYFQQQHLQYHKKNQAQQARNLYKHQLQILKKQFWNRATGIIKTNPSIQHAFIHNNAQKLQSLLAPKLEVIQEEHPFLESLALLDKENQPLLYLQDASTSNTLPSFFPILSSQKAGFSCTPEGLRFYISHPIKKGGEYQGSAIFCFHPQALLKPLKQVLNVEYMLLETPQDGKPQGSIASHKGLKNYLASKNAWQNEASAYIQHQRRHYILTQTRPVYNLAQKTCGRIYLFMDTTTHHQQQRLVLIQLVSLTGVALLLSIAILYAGFGNLLQRLEAFNRELESRVEARTQELSYANAELQEEIKDHQQTQQQLSSANAELKRLSTLDDLTQVANRRRLNEILDREWRDAARHQRPLAALMVDIDYFKSYNDCYGHAQGDRILQYVARLLFECCQRPRDLVARYGGGRIPLSAAGNRYPTSLQPSGSYT